MEQGRIHLQAMRDSGGDLEQTLRALEAQSGAVELLREAAGAPEPTTLDAVHSANGGPQNYYSRDEESSKL